METKHGTPALLAFQFHMIGRIDDCCKWKRENTAAHDVFPDKCGKARLAWSKNAQEERDAPWQHLFGCVDPVCCVTLTIGLWLEVFHSTTPNGRVRPMVFGFSDKHQDEPEKAGDHGKDIVCRLLRPFFTNVGIEVEDFEEAGEGQGPARDKVGSHSVQKCASTWARSNGASKDNKDHRGGWKSLRILDGHDDVQLDWIDAMVGQVLCPGGACRCEVVDPVCTQDWIVANVTPSVAAVFGRALACLCGKALLWLAFDEAGVGWMPATMRDNMRTACVAVGTPQNPVRKRLVVVTGNDAQVCMEDVEEQNNNGNEDNNGPMAVAQGRVNDGPNLNGNTRQVPLAMMTGINALRRAVMEQNNAVELMKGSISNLRRTNMRLIQKIDSNPLHMPQRASVRRNNANANANGRSDNHNNGCKEMRQLMLMWTQELFSTQTSKTCIRCGRNACLELEATKLLDCSLPGSEDCVATSANTRAAKSFGNHSAS
jgi:hypothetical protein